MSADRRANTHNLSIRGRDYCIALSLNITPQRVMFDLKKIKVKNPGTGKFVQPKPFGIRLSIPMQDLQLQPTTPTAQPQAVVPAARGDIKTICKLSRRAGLNYEE